MKNILVLLLFVTSQQIFAQYEYLEKYLCEDLKNRTLAIQLLEETGETEKYLNIALKSIFSEWEITPVEFMTKKEIDIVRDSKDTKYALLLQKSELRKDIRSRTINQSGQKVFAPTNHSRQQYYTAFTFSYYNFNLVLTTNKKEKTITGIGFANGDLSKIDYVFLYQQLNNLINSSLNDISPSEFYNVERNIETCKSSKLILLQDFFKENDTPKISQNYKYEYDLVSFEKYQSTILDKTKNSAYCKIIWSNQINMYEW